MHRWLPYNQARDHKRELYTGEGWWCEVGVRKTDCMRRWIPYRRNTAPSINRWPLWQSTLPSMTYRSQEGFTTVWVDKIWPWNYFKIQLNYKYCVCVYSQKFGHTFLFKVIGRCAQTSVWYCIWYILSRFLITHVSHITIKHFIIVWE